MVDMNYNVNIWPDAPSAASEKALIGGQKVRHGAPKDYMNNSPGTWAKEVQRLKEALTAKVLVLIDDDQAAAIKAVETFLAKFPLSKLWVHLGNEGDFGDFARFQRMDFYRLTLKARWPTLKTVACSGGSYHSEARAMAVGAMDQEAIHRSQLGFTFKARMSIPSEVKALLAKANHPSCSIYAMGTTPTLMARRFEELYDLERLLWREIMGRTVAPVVAEWGVSPWQCYSGDPNINRDPFIKAQQEVIQRRGIEAYFFKAANDPGEDGKVHQPGIVDSTGKIIVGTQADV